MKTNNPSHSQKLTSYDLYFKFSSDFYNRFKQGHQKVVSHILSARQMMHDFWSSYTKFRVHVEGIVLMSLSISLNTDVQQLSHTCF